MWWQIKQKLHLFFDEYFLSCFGPRTIRISPIGYACTNACPMCWRIMKKITQKGGLRESELKWQQYQNLLENLPFTVNKIEIVGGGEPLLFPEIEKLLETIKEKNKFGSLITNGVVMNSGISSILVENKWDLVRISINAGSKNVYNMVNGSAYFDLVVKNINRLIELRSLKDFPRIGLHFVLQKGNFRDVKNFIDLASSLKVDFINLDTLIHDSPEKIILSDLEIKQLEKTLKKLLKTTLIENNIAEILKKIRQNSKQRQKTYFKDKYCQIVQSNLDIDSEGNTVPCCMAYGEAIEKKLDSRSIFQVWREFASFRKKLRKGQFEYFCYKKCNYSLNKK